MTGRSARTACATPSVGHQCPECVAEGLRTQRPARTAFGGGAAGRAGYVTKTLIGLNVLMMLLSIASAGGGGIAGGGLGGSDGRPDAAHPLGFGARPYAIYDGALHGVADGEYYRLVTAMFLHYGVLHLLLNMWALWVLGRSLETALGPLRFAALYLVAGLGGNVAAYCSARRTPASAGASTAIFGLFAALFVIMRRLGRDTSAVIPILVINLIFTFTVPSISIAGHLGGLVTGGALALVLAYAPRTRRTLVQSVGIGAIVVLLLALVVARTVALLVG